MIYNELLPTSLTQMFEGQDHRFKKRRNYDMKNKQTYKQKIDNS